MPWREDFITHFGPGLLPGVSFGDWWRLLRANRFAIAPRRILNAASITLGSLSNSLSRRIEQWRFGEAVAQTEVPPPLFVLGHWRSGTTHLHNLLAVDERFAFPNLCQCLHPHTFLTSERLTTGLFGMFIPRTRMGLDNVRMSWETPNEDEFALASATFLSPYLSLTFPRRMDYYDRYLTFRDVPREEILHWQAAMVTFLRKLTFKHRKPLILKSPPHTARIRLLLEMFPRARFVHIHRNPFAVFQSMRKLREMAERVWTLQSLAECDWDGRTLRQYREMYEQFFEQRPLVPAGQFHEVAYEELEADPIGQMRALYAALGIAGFDKVERKLRGYVESLAGYQKNTFRDLPAAQRQRVFTEWRRCLEEWRYPAGA